MPLGEWVIIILGSGTVGAILKSVVDWWLARGDKRVSREQAIAEANDTLAAQLRKEINQYWQADRERLEKAENRISELVGQVRQLTQSGETLRQENFQLQKQAGMDKQRMDELSKQNVDRALELSVVQNELATAKDRIAVLEATLRENGITVPDVTARRRGGTGPLNPAAAGT